MQTLDKEKIIDRLYIDRNPQGIKSDFGKTLVIAGSRDYPGAAAIASAYVSLSGCSFHALAVPDDVYGIVFGKVSRTVVHESIPQEGESFLFDEKTEGIVRKYTAVLFGNGIADTKENRLFLSRLLQDYEGCLVLDATAITLLSEDLRMLKKRNKKQTLVLTPHLGEAARLFEVEPRDRDPHSYLPEARAFVKKNDAYLLLKSCSSILLSKDVERESTYEPTAALGKAGSGDGLAGYIAGLLSYGTAHFPVDDLICFADRMIHDAAVASAARLSAGLSSITTLPYAIARIIQERMRQKKASGFAKGLDPIFL